MTDQPDHERIWLEPPAGGEYTGRMWCQEDVWTNDPEYRDDGPPTEYVRADIAKAGIMAVRERIAARLERMGFHDFAREVRKGKWG